MKGALAIAMTAGVVVFALAAPAPAGIVGLRSGGPSGLGPSSPASLQPRPDRIPSMTPDRPRPPRKHRRRAFLPIFIDDDWRERETVYVPVPVPQPPPEATPAPVPESVPPDPRGPIRRLPAPGIASAHHRLTPGEAIDPLEPIVTLDWRAHDLPEPEPGEIWVRLSRQVLRIDAGTREVLALAPDITARPGQETTR